MFIYIGNDFVIESEDVIAIFDLELMKNSRRLQQIMQEYTDMNRLYGDKTDAKSMIITDTAIYLSALSALTLRNRDELYDTI